MDTFTTVRDLIVEKFDKDPSDITLDTTLDTLAIDSLDTFDLIFLAEEKLGIQVPNAQVALASVADIVSLIDRLRAEQGKHA
jgi:acyl carrier protein